MNDDEHSPRAVRVAATGVAISAAMLLAGCGAGTAAAVSSGGGSGGGNAPPSMSGFTVLDPKLPTQARVRFVLADAEANPAHVELFYQAPGEPAERLTQVGANPAMLATSNAGVEYELPWNFAAEDELPNDAHFVDDVKVFARVEGGIQETVLGANAANIGLGNDAPEIRSIEVPAQEASSIVGIQYNTLDSSNDVVSVRIEYDIQGDDPDAGWRLARPALELTTPPFAVENVVAQKTGTTLSFFWDTDVDLAVLDRDVKLRFTALDPAVAGVVVESAVFHVDNNAEPIVTLSDGFLLVDPDQRNGIPIPYTVLDQESDEVELVFQWKYPGESFPPLPSTKASIHAMLADPSERRLRHVCTEYPTFFESRAVPIDSTSVRLPELAASASSVLARDIVGRELEVLRKQTLATPIASSWTTNPLDHPVAVLPLGDGLEALVLDRASAGTWRVREIELATGAVTRTLVSSAAGEPDTMAFEPDHRSILVASNVANAWSVERVALDDGALTHLVGFDGTTEPGRVRAIASVGRNAALITVGSSLVRLEYFDRATPRATTLFDDLATPWGIAIDPFRADHVYVAEHDAPNQAAPPGRIVVIDLAHRERRALALGAANPPLVGVAFPRSLAFDARSTGLYVVEDAGAPGPARVTRVAIGGSASAVITAASASLTSSVGAVAIGPDGLIVAALESGDIAVGGGVQQRRAIEDVAPDGQTVHVARAFRPALTPLQRLRIAHPSSVLHPTPGGSSGYFIWDSADALAGGDVQFRAVPVDSEPGFDGVTKGAKAIRAALDVDPQYVYLGNTSSIVPEDLDGDGDLDLLVYNGFGDLSVSYYAPQNENSGFGTPIEISDVGTVVAVCTGDLDGDGDLDLATANGQSNNLSVVFQTSPRVFGPKVLQLGDEGLTDECTAVVAADLDGDGDLDLASANRGNDSITIFFQTTPGVFGERALSLGGVSAPSGLVATDLDGDGDVDLASNSAAGGSLRVFFQTNPGVFGTPPIVVGDASASSQGVKVSDLDGDGALDLVCPEYTPDEGYALVSYAQTSTGEFVRMPLAIVSDPSLAYLAIAKLADLDADGDVDLVTQSQDGVRIQFQTGPGVFESFTLEGVGVASPVAVGDLDGDGCVDFMSPVNQFLRIYRPARRGFRHGQPILVGAPSVRSVAAGDLDSDGDLDFATANSGDGTLVVYFQSSLGRFQSTPVVLRTPNATDAPISVVAADLDRDGDLDLASANSNANTLSIYFQEGAGVFGATPLTLGSASLTNNPRAIVAADLDGDGDIDLASANSESNNITVFFQDPGGVFDTSPLSIGNATVMQGPESLVAADLDEDGDLDLATANLLSDSLTVFFQEGPRSFSAAPLRLGNGLTTRRPRSVVAADLDGDGDMDLVSLNEGAGTLTVFFQRGAGTFDPVPLTLAPGMVMSGAASVTATDFDGDGDLDLLACVDGYFVNAFLQIGAGVFADAPLLVGKDSLQSDYLYAGIVLPADLDADGDLDFVFAWSNSSVINVVWNKH